MQGILISESPVVVFFGIVVLSSEVTVNNGGISTTPTDQLWNPDDRQSETSKMTNTLQEFVSLHASEDLEYAL